LPRVEPATPVKSSSTVPWSESVPCHQIITGPGPGRSSENCPCGFSSRPGSRRVQFEVWKRALKRAPKRALKVFGRVGDSRHPQEIVSLIPTHNHANLYTSAALREVTAAERFSRLSEQ
jgi:hypothetical protein